MIALFRAAVASPSLPVACACLTREVSVKLHTPDYGAAAARVRLNEQRGLGQSWHIAELGW